MTNLKDTIFLPKTDYQLRPEFLNTEPALIAEWKEKDIYNLRNEGKAEMFVLHDGPPYANSNIHVGHAMNKIHKDIIARAQSMAGKKVSFIPGWDCHGLPIEWKIEEKYRAAGKNKNDVPILEFRQECRDYAAEWVKIQSEEFQRLGVCADWQNPYITMDFETEAWIASEVRGFAGSGNLYRAHRPVIWSPVEQTALAEAEVEYEDRKNTSIYVKFPIKYSSMPLLDGASLVAWTTTPWTIPCNRALAVSQNIFYCEVTVISSPNDAFNGERYIMARSRVDAFCAATGMEVRFSKNDWKFDSNDLIECHHTINQLHQDTGHQHIFAKAEVPVLFGEFVTDDVGTGIVHIAPSHGIEDFNLCKENEELCWANSNIKLELTDYVTKNGTYKADLPLFGGIHVYKALAPVLAALSECGSLLGVSESLHSTALSWRSKAPVIYLATPQWFIPMDTVGADGKTIRERSYNALENVEFIPEASRVRLQQMLMTRPDWCISRQRSWGVPITLFVNKKTGEILRDCDVDGAIDTYIRMFGSDVWFDKPAGYFLNAYEAFPNAYDPDDYEMIMDVVDVWFESGASYSYVLDKRGLPPADVYLEGTDQHRGWFQASLIESCAFSPDTIHRRGSAPFKTLITDGFVLDKHGKKMSKSLNNVVPPEKIIDEYGADVLRLWVATSDTTEDVRVGDAVMKQQNEVYRKLRNTLRYLVGILCETTLSPEMPNFKSTFGGTYLDHESQVYLEHYVLLKLKAINKLIVAAIENHDWKKVVSEIHNFCVNDLSMYFDARKDVLYCGQGEFTPDRAVTIKMMEFLFHHLVRWLAPVLPFATEEAWQSIFGNTSSVHLLTFDIQDIKFGMTDIEEHFEFPEFWQKIKSVRSDILKSLEELRASKKIGSSLEAMLLLDHSLYWKNENRWVFKDWQNMAGVSQISGMISADEGLFSTRKIIGNLKCDRCWKFVCYASLTHPDETNRPEHRLCSRCEPFVCYPETEQ